MPIDLLLDFQIFTIFAHWTMVGVLWYAQTI